MEVDIWPRPHMILSFASSGILRFYISCFCQTALIFVLFLTCHPTSRFPPTSSQFWAPRITRYLNLHVSKIVPLQLYVGTAFLMSIFGKTEYNWVIRDIQIYHTFEKDMPKQILSSTSGSSEDLFLHLLFQHSEISLHIWSPTRRCWKAPKSKWFPKRRITHFRS